MIQSFVVFLFLLLMQNQGVEQKSAAEIRSFIKDINMTALPSSVEDVIKTAVQLPLKMEGTFKDTLVGMAKKRTHAVKVNAIRQALLENPRTKQEITAWMKENFLSYQQPYYLTCEVTLMRFYLASIGIFELDEFELFEYFPKHNSDPDVGMVMADLKGTPWMPDGSVNWINYGAHAAVWAGTMNKVLEMYGVDDLFVAEKAYLNDEEVYNYIKTSEDCTGVVLWVAENVLGRRPWIRDKQVYGQHVQILAPTIQDEKMILLELSGGAKFIQYVKSGQNRDMFNNQVVLLKKLF